MTPKIFRILLFIAILLLVYLFFAFDLTQYLTLDYIKSRQASFEDFYAAHKNLSIALYLGTYILVTALSLPGATVMTLAGGALFGLWRTLIMVSFASTIGATLAFWAARFLFRGAVQKKFGARLAAINDGVAREGGFYLFTLRLVPIFPFFMINLLMGLTPIKTVTFFLISQIGMLPGTLVYVNAGTQLGKIESLQGVLSLNLILSFALLGLFPLVAKKVVAWIKARKVMARYPRPKRFDYNLVVIGAGSAGLVSSYIAAIVRSKVALIEKHKMGGDCLNTGCVPSKALIKTAKIISYAKRAREFGLNDIQVTFSFQDVMARVKKIVQQIEPHDSVERYTGLGVECIAGTARVTSPYTVEVDGKTLTTRSIIIASGARPFVPPIPGLDQIPFLTSDTVWALKTLPKRLVVLGGGPIGSELTQAFALLGAQVTQVEMAARILNREDEEISNQIKVRFESLGIRVLTNHQAKAVKTEGHEHRLICDHRGQEVTVPFDQILVAVGRKPNTEGLGLEELGIRLAADKTIETNGLLQTRIPNIYCAGDVAGPYQFTHTAAHQAWYAAVNALFGTFKKFKVDYRVIPWATFTDPEVARVGLNELEAREQGIAFEVTTYGIDDLDRAIADSEDHGFVKVLTEPGKDKIIGATILGAHASEIIAEFVLAMRHGLGLNKIMGTIHIYPTLAEANKYTAGEWKKAHAPGKILDWIEKYHCLKRRAPIKGESL